MVGKKLSFIGMLSIAIIVLTSFLGFLFPYSFAYPLSLPMLVMLALFAFSAWKDYNATKISRKFKILFCVLLALIIISEAVVAYMYFVLLPQLTS